MAVIPSATNWAILTDRAVGYEDSYGFVSKSNLLVQPSQGEIFGHPSLLVPNKRNKTEQLGGFTEWVFPDTYPSTHFLSGLAELLLCHRNGLSKRMICQDLSESEYLSFQKKKEKKRKAQELRERALNGWDSS